MVEQGVLTVMVLLAANRAIPKDVQWTVLVHGVHGVVAVQHAVVDSSPALTPSPRQLQMVEQGVLFSVALSPSNRVIPKDVHWTVLVHGAHGEAAV